MYQRLSNSLLINQFKKLIKNYCNDLFEETKISEKKNNENENDWNEQDDDKSESMIIENDCSDDDEIMEEIMEEKEPNQKEVIESFMNCEVDYMINEKNANAINHSELIVPDTYLSIENLLVNQFEESPNSLFKNNDNQHSGVTKTNIPECGKSPPINTEYIYTEDSHINQSISYSVVKEEIEEQIEYDLRQKPQRPKATIGTYS